jgi:hypothetical protein
MTSLEQDVDRLKEYNRWRELSAKMRDRGCKALVGSLDPGAPDARIEWKPLERGDTLEIAELLKALLVHRPTRRDNPEAIRRLTTLLEQVPAREAFSDDPDRLPVLRSAKAMCALAAAPDSAFSSAVMYFLYRIVREIYIAEPPDWSVGSARAGDGSAPNGYVTWQCVRAIIDFQQALKTDRTAAERRRDGVGAERAAARGVHKRTVETRGT